MQRLGGWGVPPSVPVPETRAYRSPQKRHNSVVNVTTQPISPLSATIDCT